MCINHDPKISRRAALTGGLASAAAGALTATGAQAQESDPYRRHGAEW
ncbi:hypothetical protein [Pseudophaeobacter sp.]